MLYADFVLQKPLYGVTKKISSPSLNVGDRFIYLNYECLLFKTNADPVNGKFLCCDEKGRLEWIDGEIKVTRINGIAIDFYVHSCQFKNEYLSKKGNY